MDFKGKVMNKNGAALAGVKVSNGRHICLTDSAGEFCLPYWERSSAVFVMLLTNGQDDWYILTENRREDYMFYIDAAKTSAENFCFLHMSDTEIENKRCIFMPAVQKAVTENKPAFLINTGDLCRADGVKYHIRQMNSRTAGCPVRYTIGNHDFLEGPYGEYSYERLYGPLWYSFDCGNIHFVAAPIAKGDFPSGYDEEDFWIWLEKDIEMMRPSQKLVIFGHTHCKDLRQFRPNIGGKVYDLQAAGLIAWIFGHYHIHCTNESAGILNICTSQPHCGGIDSSPSGIRRISINGSTLSTDIIFSAKTYTSDRAEWETSLPGHIQFCDPLEWNDSIIICTNDDGYPKQCGIFCLDRSGEIKWRFMTKNGFRGSAALYKDKLYAQDSAGMLYCLDPLNGGLIWKTQAKLKPIGDTRLSVTAAGGKVFGGCPGLIQAFDADSGAPIWCAQELSSENSPAEHILDANNGRLIVSAQWSCLYAIDIEDGKICWKQVWDSSPGFPCPAWFRSSAPLLHDGLIYGSGNIGAFILNASDGALILQKKLGCNTDSRSAPVMDNKTLYISTADSGVLALDPKTLNILRRFETGPAGIYTSPYTYGNIMTVESPLIIRGNLLIFAASDGNIYFYDKNTAALKEKIQLGAPALTAPIIKDNSVTAADFYACVRKFKIKNI